MAHIRDAGRDDADSIIHLIAGMIGDTNPQETAKAVTEGFFTGTTYKTFVILEVDQVVGFGVVKRDAFEGAHGVTEIVWLAIEESHRERGYGKTLVDHIEDFAKRETIRKLYLKTSPSNKKAVCFWIMRDYQFEARMLDFSMENLDDYYLGKVLSDEMGSG